MGLQLCHFHTTTLQLFCLTTDAKYQLQLKRTLFFKVTFCYKFYPRKTVGRKAIGLVFNQDYSFEILQQLFSFCSLVTRQMQYEHNVAKGESNQT